MWMSSDSLAWWIDYALKRVAPNQIPRSGEDGKAADFISAHVYIDDRHYIIKARQGLRLKCLRVSEEGHAADEYISLYDAWLAKVDIRHFYGLFDLKWDTWDSFALDQLTRLPYLKIAYRNIRSNYVFFRLRRRKAVTWERNQVLKAVFSEQMKSPGPVSYLLLLRAIYADSPLNTQNIEVIGNRLTALLSSLVSTGELNTPSPMTYSVTGLGVAAIENYEELERKHKEIIGIQGAMLWLTAALMIFAMLQAKVIDVPPLLKLEHWPWQGKSGPQQKYN